MYPLVAALLLMILKMYSELAGSMLAILNIPLCMYSILYITVY